MASRDSILPIRGFRGLNLREDSAVIDNSELSELINFDIGRAGELRSRSGFIQISSGSTLGNNNTHILGHFVTDVLSQLIVKAGNNVYYSTDGISYTLLGAYSDASYGVQYAGKFYIIRSGDTIIEWDGAAASVIAGSPTGTFAIVHKDRMFVLNTMAAGSLSSRFSYSDAGDVSATGWSGSQFIDVQPGDGDFLVSMFILQDLLVIFKGKSTWALYIQGLPVDWVLRSLNAELGCISKYAMQLIEGYLYFSSAIGVYRTDSAAFTKISDPIAPVLEDRIVNTTTVNIDSFAYWEDKLICLLAPDSSTKEYYVYHVIPNGWSKWSFTSSLVPGTFIEVLTNTPQRGLYAGNLGNQGKVYRFGDDVYTDLGNSYTASLITKQFDVDQPSLMKRGKWISLDVVGQAEIQWSHEVDDVAVSNDSIDTTTTRQGVKIPGPGYFRAWKMTLTFAPVGQVTLIGLAMHMQIRRSVIKALT